MKEEEFIAEVTAKDGFVVEEEEFKCIYCKFLKNCKNAKARNYNACSECEKIEEKKQ